MKVLWTNKDKKIAILSLSGGGRGATEKDRKIAAKKDKKIAILSLYLLYLYHV